MIWQTVSQLWEVAMPRFIEGKNRRKTLLLPECLDDHVTQDNPVRVIDAFIDELDLQALGLTRASLPPREGPATIRPSCSRSISTATCIDCPRGSGGVLMPCRYAKARLSMSSARSKA